MFQYTVSITAFGIGLFVVHNLTPAIPTQVTNGFLFKSFLLFNKTFILQTSHFLFNKIFPFQQNISFSKNILIVRTNYERQKIFFTNYLLYNKIFSSHTKHFLCKIKTKTFKEWLYRINFKGFTWYCRLVFKVNIADYIQTLHLL